MKEILTKYIDYLKYRASLKYYKCEHDWELLDIYDVTNKFNPGSKWKSRSYRCNKCCEHKVLSDY